MGKSAIAYCRESERKLALPTNENTENTQAAENIEKFNAKPTTENSTSILMNKVHSGK